MRYEKWPMMQELDDSGLSGGGGTGGESVEQDQPTGQPSQPSPTDLGIESPFSHPSLKGLSEEEIATRLSVLGETVNEQGARLTRMSQERSVPPVAAPVQTPFEEIDSAKFFENPADATRRIVEDTVSRQLRSIVDPLINDLKAQKTQGMLDGFRTKYSDFNTHWPYIQEQLQKYGVPQEIANEETIETLYLKSVGLAAMQGRGPVDMTEKSRAAPPQHKASSQPIPPAAPKKQTRELTEGEKRMARIQGFKTDEEYLNYQAMYADEVLGDN